MGIGMILSRPTIERGLTFRVIIAFCIGLGAISHSGAAELWGRNTETPFAYLVGGERAWQLTDRPLGSRESLVLSGETPNGMTVTLNSDGQVKVVVEDDLRQKVDLGVVLTREDGSQTKQDLRFWPAPPIRPVSYLSDQVDDLIQLFRDPQSGKWRPVTRDAFDQYFRRLQCHGIARLIVWPSAFPTINSRANYGAENWSKFERQANAILNSEDLNRILYEDRAYSPYEWQQLLMRFRLNPDWGRMFTQSAAAHGISLTVSYRPFEHALMKYYVIPVFDSKGRYLWDFLPGANPKVNFESYDVGFAHYRKILEQHRKTQHIRLQSVRLEAVAESGGQAVTEKHLRVFAAQVPPIAKDSFVLQRNDDGEFQLVKFGTIVGDVENQRVELKNWSVKCDQDGAIVIDDIHQPSSHRYLIIRRGDIEEDVELPVELPVKVISTAGTQIGRINAHWALEDITAENATTRLGGITADGSYRTDFQAIENSFVLVRRSGKALRSLGNDEVVIDLGGDWSPEMMDYNRPAARQLAVSEIRTILNQPAFDEIVINTRTHTQLAGSSGDGELGVQTLAHHRRRSKNYFHLGIDRAYAPLSASELPVIKKLLERDTLESIEVISNWYTGEWMGTCQTETDGHPWRYARNQSIANGIRSLIQTLEEEFPDTRIRVMLPPRDLVENTVKQRLSQIENPADGNYDSKYYRFLCSGINHIPAICEGMSMVDLTGLRSEPMFLGLRDLPDPKPVELFVRQYQKNQSDNHGSSFRGPKSFFYEAQYTLRFADKEAASARREEIIRELLNQPDIGEVILYEAVNWIYGLSMDDPHSYLAP